MHDKQIRRRRAVLAVLVGVSLILLTAYFGESQSSPLHNVQRGVAEVLSPLQTGASRALKPVRDIASWVSDTLHAKSQVDGLRRELQTYEAEAARYRSAWLLNQQLSQEVGLDEHLGIGGRDLVSAQVIVRDPTLWYQTVEVDKGSDDGVRVHDPVIGDQALVGTVSFVGPTFSVVSLITDHTVSVTAQVLDRNGDTGELVPAVGSPNELVLQDLQISDPQQALSGPQVGQLVSTAGFKSQTLESYYPQGIPIGVVSSVNTNEEISSGTIQVTPSADLRQLAVVQILTNPQAGLERAQVP